MCSGLCEIKDTGDRARLIWPAWEYRLFFTHSTDNSINKPLKKISTHCFYRVQHGTDTVLGQGFEALRICNTYCSITREFRFRNTWNCAAEGSSFRATGRLKESKCFHLFGSLSVHSLLLVFHLYWILPESRQPKKKATKNVNCLFNPEHHSSCITRNHSECGVCGESEREKRSIVEMCLCCFIYHWLDKIKKP